MTRCGVGLSRPLVQRVSCSPTTFSTTGFTSDETSLSFVCEENFGSGTFTDSTAIRATAPEENFRTS